MNDNYRNEIPTDAQRNPLTPAPQTEEYEICKNDGTLMPLNGRCSLCGQTRAEQEQKFSKFIRDE